MPKRHLYKKTGSNSKTDLGLTVTQEEITSWNNKVDKTTTINGKELSSNIELTATDVGAELSFEKNTAFNKNFSNIKPEMSGIADAGSSTEVSRADHIHPSDTKKQATLVSGKNIKTINGKSLLGEGDIEIGGSIDGATPTNIGGVCGYAPDINSSEAAFAEPRNVSLGYSANTNNSGDQNVSIGFQSLFSNETGKNNISIGNNSADSITTGNNNISIGHHANRNVTTGSNNTTIGSNAGQLNVVNNSIAIGCNAHNNNHNNIQIGEGTNNAANTMSIGGTNFLINKISVYGTRNNVTASRELGYQDDINNLTKNTINISNQFDGFSAGTESSTISGSAVGYASSSTNGFAGGAGAKTGNGAAIGMNAQTIDTNNNVIDAIQLGTGTNKTTKTLQVYDKQLLDANGKIPDERLNTTIARISDVDSKDTTTLNSAKTYTDTKVAALVNGAPETLDTLDEIAAALKDNADIIDTLNSAIGNKANANEVVTLTTAQNITADKTFSGYMKIIGTAAERHLITRGIGGCSTDGTNNDDLYINYGTEYGLKVGKTGQLSINKDGNLNTSGTIKGSTLYENNTALSSKYQAKGDYATTSSLNNKVDKVDGKGLSTNDYTTAEKTKLSGIENGANKTTIIFRRW